ncbi:MAG: hypothetical protein RIC85_02950 [Gammaproteobacteria bacterium]
MNWELAAVVAQIVGAIAVVVSLVYLALQVRSQTRESRLNATRELAQDFRNLVAEVSRDEDLYALFRRSLNDYDSLGEEERARIHMYFYSRIFGLHEQVHLHLKHKNIDTMFLESIQNRFSELIHTQGFRAWWQRNSYIYTKEFQEYVGRIIAVNESNPHSSPKRSV